MTATRRPVRTLDLGTNAEDLPGGIFVALARSGALLQTTTLVLSCAPRVDEFALAEHLPRVETLSLRACSMSAVPALPRLRRVDLYPRYGCPPFPQLTAQLAAVAPQLERLQAGGIAGCGLAAIQPGALRFPHLRLLRLSNNEGLCFDELAAAAPVLGQLQDLDLSSCRITNMPEGMLRLPSLQRLNLGNNQGLCLDELRAAQPVLTELTWLNLNGCYLPSAEPVTGLHALRTLSLKNNRLTDLAGFDGLPHLQSLDLCWAGLTSGGPGAFQHPALRELKMDHVRADAVALAAAAPVLTSLQRLQMVSCRLGDISGVLRLPALRWLSLSQNRGVDLQELVDAAPVLTALELLDISSCGVHELPAGALRLPALRELQMHGNQLLLDELAAAAPVLTRLEKLNVGCSGLREVCAGAFWLPALKHLDASWNKHGALMPELAAAAAAHMLDRLEELRLKDCEIPRAEVKALGLPRLRKCVHH